MDQRKKHNGQPYKYRYQVAEEVLANNGTNEEIQRRILQEFPHSRENPTRAQWYRTSFEKFGHCRGRRVPKGKLGRKPIPQHEAKGKIVPVRFTAEDIRAIDAAAKASNQSVSEWVRSTIHATIQP
jgi:hypothetical protein